MTFTSRTSLYEYVRFEPLPWAGVIDGVTKSVRAQ
jgi:hypothetical protein